MIPPLDLESICSVLDLAHARLQQLRPERPHSDGGIGQLAFDELSASVRWKRYLDATDIPTP